MLYRELLKSDFNGIHELVCQIHELHVSNRPDIYMG